MNEILMLAFSMVGFVVTLIVTIYMMFTFSCWLCEFIYKKKWEYTIKHRFDKPPTAKCYCVDCDRHDNTARCIKFDHYTADNWFCWDAEPRKDKEK